MVNFSVQPMALPNIYQFLALFYPFCHALYRSKFTAINVNICHLLCMKKFSMIETQIQDRLQPADERGERNG